MALAAVSAPYVCQAQDPAGKFKRITQLQTTGKIKEAIAQCDEMLEYFSDGKSRTVAQYGFYEPFFVWKKGELLMASKDYDQAYATFQNLSTNTKYQDKNMRERARRKKLLNGQGYDPYLTASKYYMALCKYQKGVGDGKDQKSPEAFAEAIPLLHLSSLARKLNALQRNGYDLAIISWLSKSGSDAYNEAVTAVKMAWLKKHLPSVAWDRITIVPYGTPKQNFCETPFDILFDDEARNRDNWTGIAYDVQNIMEILKNL